MRDINGDDSFFTALVLVPDSNKVKVIYGLGMGTAGIGHISAVSGKLLALLGEGGGGPGTRTIHCVGCATTSENGTPKFNFG